MNHARVVRRFSDHVVVADGAMGSELLARLPAGAHLDLAPIEHPHHVTDIHLAYLRAGAEVIETATFAASRPRLVRFGLGDLTETVNSAGAKLAREAREVAGVDCLVAGSIGPLAGVLDMDEPEGRSAIAVAHAEQASVLAGRGVDLLILETFFRIDELDLAIDAVREVTSLPLVALYTFADESQPEVIQTQALGVRGLLERDLLAAGVNCAPGPFGALAVLQAIENPPGRLAAMPNAGLLVRREGRLLSPPATPSYLARFATQAAAAGVALLGGCCGTGPEHIKAMADAVRGMQATPCSRSRVVVPSPHDQTHPLPRRPTSTLAEKLTGGRFVRVVQLDPPKGTNSDRLLAAVKAIAHHPDVDAVDINSNPLARLRMDSLWLAAEVQRTAGIETIAHVTPRDASLMGLQSQLLGAWRAGVRNVLAITGDPSQLGRLPGRS